jgi:hypothetical protein
MSLLSQFPKKPFKSPQPPFAKGERGEIFPQSAMHHVGCMAALNPSWFKAHSTFRLRGIGDQIFCQSLDQFFSRQGTVNSKL